MIRLNDKLIYEVSKWNHRLTAEESRYVTSTYAFNDKAVFTFTMQNWLNRWTYCTRVYKIMMSQHFYNFLWSPKKQISASIIAGFELQQTSNRVEWITIEHVPLKTILEHMNTFCIAFSNLQLPLQELSDRDFYEIFRSEIRWHQNYCRKYIQNT